MRGTFARVDTATDSAGLPVSLLEAIDADGGLWAAGDHYTDGPTVVGEVRRVRARALRLDFRDLAILRDLPDVRYLHLRSDGRPDLAPVASLRQLRALIVETSALRGDLDPLDFPELRWLSLSLGGKGGRALLPSVQRGHPGLRHLQLVEVPFRTIEEAASGFPELEHLRIAFADRLRAVGDLRAVASSLRGIVLNLTQLRSLDGIEGLQRLETLSIMGGQVSDVAPIAAMPSIRYLSLDTVPGVSLEPLRGHENIRLLALSLVTDPDLAVLETLPGLIAVSRGPRLAAETRWPDQRRQPHDDPLHREWRRAIAG
jgi:hypothetical protein